MDGLTNESSNFSDVPALGDEQGLNAFLENEQMAAQGIQPVAPTLTPAANAPVAGGTTGQNTVAGVAAAPVQQMATPAGQSAANPIPGQQNLGTQGTGDGITKEQLGQIMNGINAINQRLGTPGPAQGQVNNPQSMPVNPMQTGYTEQERAFINAALSRGYSLDQINATIMNRRMGGVNNAALEQRMAQLENTLKSQEYKAAETAFIGKLTEFGNKFGLSEQDLVTFGNVALTKGINIAMPNVDLETVFRAVYPEQYRIRTQRMSPTNASQIYGGTSIPEGNRAAAARMEDAYVEQFLKKAMPNYGKTN